MKHYLLSRQSPDYPAALSVLDAPPEPLYLSGRLPGGTYIAIVGSRHPSSYGRHMTWHLASDLAASGFVIVSGLALGVDSIAHEAALSVGGKTVAVLPAGLDTVHPRAHEGLARRIIEQGGALVSEHPAGTPAFKQHFVARNRIVTGLAAGVILTEADDKSGTRHTMQFALDQGRDIWAVPGHVTSPLSVGANELLRRRYANAVIDSSDIIAHYGAVAASPAPVLSNRDPRQHQVIELIQAGRSTTQQLVEHSGLSAIELADILSLLEISGHIRGLGAGQWATGR